MPDSIRLDIELTNHGWATIQLTAPGAALKFAASYTPRDSISDLARAAAGLVAGIPEQLVTWSLEPIEYEFQFTTAGGRTRLQVQEFPDLRRQRSRTGTPTVVLDGDAIAMARAIWRGLRRLQVVVPLEEFVAKWGHSFPTDTVEQLGKKLRDTNVP